MKHWIVCQLGAREHYAIPRALHQKKHLHQLITDTWVTPSSLFHYLPNQFSRPLCDRYHSQIPSEKIISSNYSSISFELKQRLLNFEGWTKIINRNQWFQSYALDFLSNINGDVLHKRSPIIFSYSYTALRIFRYAKSRGWKTVLGQIDPGITEEKKVAQLQAKYRQQYPSQWSPAPLRYWENWKQECKLADHILVNSVWSKEALMEVGILASKISIVPLAYQVPTKTFSFSRSYPSTFTQERPLRVLFLGQLILRKGLAAVLDAVSHLSDKYIEFWLVGPTKLALSADLLANPRIKYTGRVARSEVQKYYQQADVFLFPTHSDGFGLTQLEAQAWHLPIIASPYCGEVVKHGQNGLVLSEVSAHSIANALSNCHEQPHLLKEWSDNSIDMSFYSINKLSDTLENLSYASI